MRKITLPVSGKLTGETVATKWEIERNVPTDLADFMANYNEAAVFDFAYRQLTTDLKNASRRSKCGTISVAACDTRLKDCFRQSNAKDFFGEIQSLSIEIADAKLVAKDDRPNACAVIMESISALESLMAGLEV